ncbi:MAG TPA: alkaline phosphatase family protein [bacterium]|nr:alkaline phosphatase family protein [bacterium]
MSDKLHVMAEAVREAYARGEEDEALRPLVLADGEGRAVGRIGHGDPVIFYDIRGEREVELTRAFVDPSFQEFDTAGRLARFFTMIEYHSELAAEAAFPPEVAIKGTMCEAVVGAGRKIVKVVESEKAVHLSYFLNGKRERPFEGERRIVVESRKDVNNYDELPAMSAGEVADQTIAEMEAGGSDVIIVNFANVDVVAHIENEAAVIQAVQAVDRELGRVLEAARMAGVTAVVTADHGTAEKWLYPDGKVDTGHTDSPVPFAIVDEKFQDVRLREGGALTDVAPTVLSLLGIAAPQEMTGSSLILGAPPGKARRLLLVICDGWGERDDEHGNLIKKADTPVMDRLRREFPFTTLAAHGEAVGMPAGKVGNSEAGHLHIGAGRRVLSDRIRIDQAISAGSLARNPAFIRAMDISVNERRPLHLLGIVSFYSSHGSVDHLYAILRMARDRGVTELYHHGLLGRRGERPEAGARYIDDVETFCEKLGLGRVVTVMGRFWALDRENNWDRVEKAYRALADGQGVGVVDSSQ